MLECFAKQRTIKLLARKTFSASNSVGLSLIPIGPTHSQHKNTREKPLNKGRESNNLCEHKQCESRKKTKKNEVQQKSLQLKHKSKCIDFYGLPFIQLFDLFASLTLSHSLTLRLSRREFIVYFIKSSFARS